jgi:hypothetical protein
VGTENCVFIFLVFIAVVIDNANIQHIATA